MAPANSLPSYGVLSSKRATVAFVTGICWWLDAPRLSFTAWITGVRHLEKVFFRLSPRQRAFFACQFLPGERLMSPQPTTNFHARGEDEEALNRSDRQRASSTKHSWPSTGKVHAIAMEPR